MDQNKAPDNVIQFPGPKHEAAVKPENKKPVSPSRKKDKASKKTLGASVLAIMLFSLAMNKYIYSQAPGSADMASAQDAAGGRQIASIGASDFPRDAAWEKKLAERLASKNVRAIASTQLGRPATDVERLRWGVLEEKYTINYKITDQTILSVLLQDPAANPSYILDRKQFLSEYGHLLDRAYVSAKLKSVETSDDKKIESYTIFDKDDRPTAEARFELDRHKRLLSLKVQPLTI